MRSLEAATGVDFCLGGDTSPDSGRYAKSLVEAGRFQFPLTIFASGSRAFLRHLGHQGQRPAEFSLICRRTAKTGQDIKIRPPAVFQACQFGLGLRETGGARNISRQQMVPGKEH